MNAQDNAWPQIRASLQSIQDEPLVAAVDSARVSFDGVYTLSADSASYTTLAANYPLLETLVQDQTGRHLRLNLTRPVPMGTDEDALAVSLDASSVMEAIVNPSAIAAVPSYLLRFVPYVGAGPVLIATALRQAFYRASRDSGADQLYPRQGDSVTIEVQALLRSLGGSISRAKFFRLFKDGALDFFVRRGEAAHTVKDGQVRRLPNTYHYRGLVLTPGDARDLYAWLLANGLAADPAGTLRRAAETSRDQILSFPFRVETAGDERFDSAASVHEVVGAALTEAGLKLDPTLAVLSDRLAQHLIRPESFLAVPWYWFQRVLPELGDDLGVLYLMARSCCYIDWARGRDRNRFWVPGGLPTLQGWIRSETLPRQIPHEQASRRGRPSQERVKQDSAYTRAWRSTVRDLAGRYLSRSAVRESESGTDWQLKVAELQLAREDEVLQDAIYAYLYNHGSPLREALRAFGESQRLYDLLSQAVRLDPARICQIETLAGVGICQIETLEAGVIRHYETLRESLNCYFEPLVGARICQFDTVLKILYRLRHSDFFQQETLPPPDSPAKAVEGRPWDHQKLLGSVNPLLAKRMLGQGDGQRFLAWLIELALTPAVHSPLSLAVSKTLEGSGLAQAGARRLADLPPSVLERMLRDGLQRLQGGYLGAAIREPDLMALLGAAPSPAEQARLLQRLLDLLEPAFS